MAQQKTKAKVGNVTQANSKLMEAALERRVAKLEGDLSVAVDALVREQEEVKTRLGKVEGDLEDTVTILVDQVKNVKSRVGRFWWTTGVWVVIAFFAAFLAYQAGGFIASILAKAFGG